jgi:hypothetical protein
VAAGIAALICAPFVVAALPAGHSSVSARTLVTRIVTSAAVPYSGYARSTGGLALPVSTGAFSVNDLLGGTTQLRVWWRSRAEWRVDSIKPSGETDLHHGGGGTWTWDYESNTAQWTEDGPADEVRLPRTDDLLPGNLARRLLHESQTADATRLPNARIAGHDAAGVRVTITDTRSTVRHIDVWALPSNGLPLRVAVYGQEATPIVSTTMYDLDTARPAAATTAFGPTPDTLTRVGGPADIVSAIDQFGNNEPPATLAGLTRRATLHLGGVGVYGRGVTLLTAIPLSARLAGTIVPQLRQVPGMVEDDTGIGIGIGAVNLQLSPPTGFGARWLLVGTVTQATLRAAVATLPPAHGFGFGR